MICTGRLASFKMRANRSGSRSSGSRVCRSQIASRSRWSARQGRAFHQRLRSLIAERRAVPVVGANGDARTRPIVRAAARAFATTLQPRCGPRASTTIGRQALRAIAAPGSGRKLVHLLRDPRLKMHAVGDVADGISSSGASGHNDRHIRRVTCPCNRLTPLLDCASRKASTVMQNGSASSF